MIDFLFLIIQTTLTLSMLLHDWIDFPPFTDIKSLRQHHTVRELVTSTLINTSIVAVGLFLQGIYYQYPYPYGVKITLVSIYTILTIGTICAWWIPYIFGSSAEHKEGFREYKNTHTVLPSRGDNVVPNTLHIILHIQIWLCCAISWYLYRRN